MLTTVRWSAVPCMPSEIAEALHKFQPDCKVLVEENHRSIFMLNHTYTPITNYESLLNLSTIASQLSRLEVCLPVMENSLWPILGNLIRSSDKLISIRIYAMANIYQRAIVPPELVPRPGRNDWLTLRSLDWLFGDLGQTKKRPKLKPRRLHLINFCLCRYNLDVQDLWLFEGLEDCATDCATVARLVAREAFHLSTFALTIKSGKHHEFNGCNTRLDTGMTQALLMDFRKLHHLTLYNGTAALDGEIINSLGALQSLRLHEWRHPREVHRPLLSTELIQILGQSCPDLHELSLDIPAAMSKVSSQE